MIISVASGKGGTGKTTVAVNLALAATEPVQFIDCDVEAPNSHLFLRPEIAGEESAGVLVPIFETRLCGKCGRCVEFCEFNALAFVNDFPMVFPELCHSCGGCTRVCPNGAIREVRRRIGIIQIGHAGNIRFIQGRLDIGEVTARALIREVKTRMQAFPLSIIDSPPGASCPFIEAVQGSEFVVLVAEPTPFGLNDLMIAVETVRVLGISHGVVINRVGIGDDRVHRYCAEEGIPLLLEIPDDRRIAEAYSVGRSLIEELPELLPAFETLWHKVASALSRAG